MIVIKVDKDGNVTKETGFKRLDIFTTTVTEPKMSNLLEIYLPEFNIGTFSDSEHNYTQVMETLVGNVIMKNSNTRFFPHGPNSGWTNTSGYIMNSALNTKMFKLDIGIIHANVGAYNLYFFAWNLYHKTANDDDFQFESCGPYPSSDPTPTEPIKFDCKVYECTFSGTKTAIDNGTPGTYISFGTTIGYYKIFRKDNTILTWGYQESSTTVPNFLCTDLGNCGNFTIICDKTNAAVKKIEAQINTINDEDIPELTAAIEAVGGRIAQVDSGLRGSFIAG